MSEPRLKVISIASCWRSGSTLFGRILGHADGVITTGGLGYLWKYGIVNDWPCTCGADIRACSFWRAVFDQAYGGFEGTQIRAAQRAAVPMLSSGDMFKTLIAWPEPSFQDRIRTQASTLASMYQAIARVSNSRVVVDSSRFPSYALALGTVPSIDLYVVHLVRDSRAVVYSVQRRNAEMNGNSAIAYANAKDTARFSWGWIRRNSSAESLRPRQRYMKLRYEDFARNPRAAVNKVGEFVGEDLSSVPFVSDNVVTLRDEHEVEGNRLRFHNGDTTIRLDDEWQRKMPQRQKAAITALTWPLLRRYGYLD